MNQVHLYLSASQRESCVRALNTAQRWAQGDIGVFAELADAGFLRNKDGKHLSLSLWSTIVEPALTEYASLAAGTTPGAILELHDPATHPIAAICWQLQQHWAGTKVSRKCTTLAALPKDMDIHRTSVQKFDVYKRSKESCELTLQGATSKQVTTQCNIREPVFKLSVSHTDVHRLMRVLDVYSRILMNQWENLKELTDDRWEHRRNDWHERVEEAVKAFKPSWTGYSMNASSGIYSQNIHPEANVVFSVYKALRHWEMVHRLGYTHRGVSTDAPMRSDEWPFVDGDAGASLETLPVGGGLVYSAGHYHAVEAYKPTANPNGRTLAASYSPVSLLDALAYSQVHPEKTPNF